MGRPKSIDATLLALKGKLLEFDREHGLTVGENENPIDRVAVYILLQDLKAIFFGNTKMVAPFYLDKIKEIDAEMTYLYPAKFDKLAKESAQKAGVDEPESVKRAREIADEVRRGIHRCVKCNSIVNITDGDIMWSREQGGYEHITDCTETKAN